MSSYFHHEDLVCLQKQFYQIAFMYFFITVQTSLLQSHLLMLAAVEDTLTDSFIRTNPPVVCLFLPLRLEVVVSYRVGFICLTSAGLIL